MDTSPVIKAFPTTFRLFLILTCSPKLAVLLTLTPPATKKLFFNVVSHTRLVNPKTFTLLPKSASLLTKRLLKTLSLRHIFSCTFDN